MSDDENKTRTRKPLGLKRSVESGEVKQTFSHGRTNKVAVEVKRRGEIDGVETISEGSGTDRQVIIMVETTG